MPRQSAKKLVFSLIYTTLQMFIVFGNANAQHVIVEDIDWNSNGTHILRAFSTDTLEIVDIGNGQNFQIPLTGIFKNFEWNPTYPTLFAVADNLHF
jgi:hypothetical protein